MDDGDTNCSTASERLVWLLISQPRNVVQVTSCECESLRHVLIERLTGAVSIMAPVFFLGRAVNYLGDDPLLGIVPFGLTPDPKGSSF